MPDAPNASIDAVTMLNAARGGFEIAIGLVFTKASSDEVVCEVPVGPHLHQPYGLVHGGVYAAIIETAASVGAAMVAMPRGQTAVGLENATSFVRAVRTGKLIGRALPITRGRQTQVWEVEVRGDDGQIAATGRVRMLCLSPGAQIAGQTVALTHGRAEGQAAPDPADRSDKP
ncbi:MAG TPA: PaaI family thioesterase [Kofleriaceae bacterium]|nr:PaaI family thioesterase [Kofleriaceae bacterium]